MYINPFKNRHSNDLILYESNYQNGQGNEGQMV
jgi:hypothetical protein